MTVPTARGYKLMTKLFHDWGGLRNLMVMNDDAHTKFNVYPIGGPLHDDLQGAIFTKIKEPK